MFDCYDTLITPEEVADMLGCTDFRYRQGYAQGKLCYTGNGNEPCCAEQCLSRS